ncbi:hypothetical protein KKD81_00995 [Patescibacteria group bacterium]|nr:hypothetical protein [Patescibacteria group bacterium]MBU2159145.1 hypothetical protein [Patescibacteria group bacterium]MBU2220495.1 hypothetical protein [Patescibacteria group bacterium]
MIRGVALVLSVLSLFIFPHSVSAVLILASALLLPFSGLALGLIAEALYFSPGAHFLPVWALFGALATSAALLVHRFVKTRIIE